MNNKGSAVISIIIASAFIVFLILPVFAFVMEKQITNTKISSVKECMDITNRAVYTALKKDSLCKSEVELSINNGKEQFAALLKKNMNLDDGFMPKGVCPAAGKVEILKFDIYREDDSTIYISSQIRIPLKPSLYLGELCVLDKDGLVHIIVEALSSMPVDN